MNSEIYTHLRHLYGDEKAAAILPRLETLIAAYGEQISAPGDRSSHFEPGDAVLITYGDMVQAAGEPPLSVLADFLRERVAGAINGVHLLPFFPYSRTTVFP